MQWKMLQQDEPEDYVISSGNHYSVKEFINECLNVLNIKVDWKGKDENEHAINIENGKKIISVSSLYFRPTDVNQLLGDSRKARIKLGWKPKINFTELVKEMVEHDLNIANKEKVILDYDYKI